MQVVEWAAAAATNPVSRWVSEDWFLLSFDWLLRIYGSLSLVLRIYDWFHWVKDWCDWATSAPESPETPDNPDDSEKEMWITRGVLKAPRVFHVCESCQYLERGLVKYKLKQCNTCAKRL